MKHPKLEVTKRTIFGKNLKKLRRKGILPGNIYGKGVDSTAVQVGEKEFEAIYKEVGGSGLVDVTLDGQARPALIHNLQKDYVSKKVLHADFFQVNLKEKVKTMVPVVLIGEAQAVTDKVGLLMQPVSEVEVEALPENLPENIEINVEKLAVVDDQITVEQLSLPEGVVVLNEPSQVLVKVAELVSEEAKADAAAAEAAAAEAAATTEGAEGEAPAEGDAPKEEASEEKNAEEAPKE